MDTVPEFLNGLQSNLDFYAVVFAIFAVITVGSGLVTILSKKLMRSAIALLFTFFGVAGLYALLAADFVAITQIMVYIGGILTLIIFGVMLTTRMTGVERKTTPFAGTSVAIGAIIAALCTAFLSYLFITSDWKVTEVAKIPDGTINDIGNLLMTNYLAAFMTAAILLLIAFIGAALIARRKN